MRKRLFCATIAAALFITLTACSGAGRTSAPDIDRTPAPSAYKLAPSELSAEAFAGAAPTHSGSGSSSGASGLSGASIAAAPENRDDGDYILSFAGDCTLATDHMTYGAEGSFVSVVGDDYGYPFSGALEYFENDDLTLVNLECVLTGNGEPVEKTYRFRGPPEYAKILSAGSVECVSLANNHTGDYGQEGLEDTKAALESESVSYIDDGGVCLYEIENGPAIGICAGYYYHGRINQNVQLLRESGADIVIAVMHMGDEGEYDVTSSQISVAHGAIDAGADIVVGHHPHVLQKIEYYGNGVIYYSLANFSFGGNRFPSDRDTAVIRQHITRNDDGTYSLGDTDIIPFSVSGSSSGNDYRPVPYSSDDAGYERVLKKLSGEWYVPPSPENTTSPSN